MGKANVAVNNWLSDNERFADLFNGALFGGRQIIHPGELEPLDREADIIVTDKDGKEKGIQRYRDIAKRWRNEVDLAVLACETQNKVHYAMPVRNMLNDSLTYMDQMKALWKQKSPRDRKKLTGEGYLSRFTKEDRLYPVVTIVFYYDVKKWDGAVDLHGMFGVGRDSGSGNASLMRQYIPNYHINLVDAGNIAMPDCFRTDLQQTFGMLKYREDKEKLKKYINENRKYFGNIDRETYQAYREFLHSEKVMKEHMAGNGKEDHIDMCKALEDLYADGVEEGMEKGMEKGQMLTLISIVKKKFLRGKSLEQMADELEEEIPVIERIYKAVAEEPEADQETIFGKLKEN